MSDTVDRSQIRPEEWAEARRYALVIEWSEENDAYLATAPDLPGVVTDGPTRAAAAEMGEEAVAVWLSSLRDDGLPIPAPGFPACPSTYGRKRSSPTPGARRNTKPIARTPACQGDIAAAFRRCHSRRPWLLGSDTVSGASKVSQPRCT